MTRIVVTIADGKDTRVVEWAAAQRGQTVEAYARDQVYGIAHIARYDHDHPDGPPFPGFGQPGGDITDPGGAVPDPPGPPEDVHVFDGFD